MSWAYPASSELSFVKIEKSFEVNKSCMNFATILSLINFIISSTVKAVSHHSLAISRKWICKFTSSEWRMWFITSLKFFFTALFFAIKHGTKTLLRTLGFLSWVSIAVLLNYGVIWSNTFPFFNMASMFCLAINAFLCLSLV